MGEWSLVPYDELLIALSFLFVAPYLVETALLACMHGPLASTRNPPTSESLPFVSVIVASYNEEDNVDAKLEDLMRQDYPEHLMEIVFVDSSTDTTRERVKAWQRRFPRIRLITEKRRTGLAHALNIGYSAARGDILVKSDCDILHDPESIANLVGNFSDRRIGAVSGRQALRRKNDPESGYRNLLDRKRRLESRFGSAYIFETFFAFRKALFGPIDERSLADEAELALEIRKKGFYTILDENAIFYEETPKFKLERIRQKQRRAQGHIQVHLRRWDIVLKRKLDVFEHIIFPATFLTVVINPWVSLAMIALVILQLLSVGPDPIAFTFALLFLIGTAVYFLGRPRHLAGLFESQIALLVAWFVLIFKGPSYVWNKQR